MSIYFSTKMELCEYLTEVRQAIERKEESFSKLKIDLSNQYLSLGGQFHEFVDDVISEGKWELRTFGNIKFGDLQARFGESRWLRMKPIDRLRDYLERFKRDPTTISMQVSSIDLYHQYPIEALIRPINYGDGGHDPEPFNQLKTSIVLNGGNPTPLDSSARGVLYFGEYALAKKVPFVVGLAPLMYPERGLVFIK